MALFAYYLTELFLSVFYRKKYHASKKEFYERQLSFAFLDWIFIPEENKKLSSADIFFANDSPFRFMDVELCQNRQQCTNKLGRPNYVFNITAKAGIKISVIFYKLIIAHTTCLLQLYFADNKLYCVDLKFGGNLETSRETVLERLQAVMQDTLPPDVKKELVTLTLQNRFADILTGKFYAHIENYFSFRIRVIPHFSKYRSLISHKKNAKTAYHKL
ncbi:hypothetical protein [Foetidibacter luteolus]|uniref:hypothetical protein n=1 Tax=Foetidibacter luteolus TaxID=2608880 RepID=UPI00129A2202|nr:hypothetical protein [Foetidibacter luteolus]